MMKKICKWLPAAATLLLAALLIAQCIGIYVDGTAPENFENGVLIRDIFSREIVISRLKGIAWAFWVWVGAVALGLAFQEKNPKRASKQFLSKRSPELRAPWLPLEGKLARNFSSVTDEVSPSRIRSCCIRGTTDGFRHPTPHPASRPPSPQGEGKMAASEASARDHERPNVGAKPLRIGLYIAAIALIALGVANGGARDVLVKAINICTECIGLG